jgi:hypothetical protein
MSPARYSRICADHGIEKPDFLSQSTWWESPNKRRARAWRDVLAELRSRTRSAGCADESGRHVPQTVVAGPADPAVRRIAGVAALVGGRLLGCGRGAGGGLAAYRPGRPGASKTSGCGGRAGRCFRSSTRCAWSSSLRCRTRRSSVPGIHVPVDRRHSHVMCDGHVVLGPGSPGVPEVRDRYAGCGLHFDGGRRTVRCGRYRGRRRAGVRARRLRHRWDLYAS